MTFARFLIAHYLEAIAYVVFLISLAIRFKQDRRGVIKILSGYYLICALLIIRATTYAGGAKGSNIFLYNLMCLLSSFSLGAYFFNVLSGKASKALVLLTCLLSSAYYLFANVVQEGLQFFDSLAYVLLATSIVVLCLFYVVQLLSNVNEEPLSLNFDFWFVASQLIYFIGAFIIFLSFGYLTKKISVDSNSVSINRTLTWLWGLHNVLLFLSSLLTAGGTLWILSRKK
jgi:hypothetical protein